MAKKPPRAQERQRQLEAAARVRVPMSCDVAVVGGGAAGLVAAITAAEAGAATVVFESDLACGRPILATGNGRCNFANTNLDPQRYNHPAFVREVCGPQWLDDILAFFHDSGLRWCHEEDRLYPLSRQAASVRNVLLARAEAAGVVLAPAREVRDVSYIAHSPYPAELAYCEPLDQDGRFVLPAARTVVLATGGEAFPFAGNLGITTTPRTPVLCPLACDDSPLSALDGRRAHVRAFLTKAGQAEPCWNEQGEVLFRDYGLSGIVTFDLSRRAQPGDLVELDLAPQLGSYELQQLVDPFATGSFAPGALDGVLDPQIARLLEALARDSWRVEWPGRGLPSSDSRALISLVKALPFVVRGVADANHAQVTRGGFATEQFDPQTLALRAHPWLFACGEALDVDADCGGFNLAWAWKSGMVAGTSAARSALDAKETAR